MKVKPAGSLFFRSFTTGLLVMLFSNNFAQPETNNQTLSDTGRYYIQKIEQYWHSNTDSSLVYAREGMNRLKGTDHPYDLAVLYFSTGAVFNRAGLPDSALRYMNLCLDISERQGFGLQKYRALEQMGCIYCDLKEYEKSLDLLSQSLAFFESVGSPKNINSALINIGYLYYQQERYVMALNYFTKATAYDSLLMTVDPESVAINQLSIGGVYSRLGDHFHDFDSVKSRNYYQTSTTYFEESLRGFQKLGHQMGVCYAFNNLIEAYMSLQENRKADSLLQLDPGCENISGAFMAIATALLKIRKLEAAGKTAEAITLLGQLHENQIQFSNSDHYHYAMIHYADLLRQAGYTDSAYQILLASQKWFLEHENLVTAHKATEMLAGWYVADGQQSIAINYLQQSARLKNMIVKEINNEIFDELTMKYQNDVLKANLKAQEAHQALQKQRFTNTLIFFGIILLLLLMAIVMLNNVRKKNRAHKLLAVEKAKTLENENKLHLSALEQARLQNQIAQNESEKQALEIQVKNQELVYYSLREIAQSQFAQNLLERLNPFLQVFNRRRDKEAFSEIVNEIRREIKSDSMDQLEVMIKQMHSGFFEKLTAINPGLTRRELHFCALLRLNLSSKEISDHLNIELSTVDRTRHNIRIKLNLDPNQNLNAFLISV